MIKLNLSIFYNLKNTIIIHNHFYIQIILNERIFPILFNYNKKLT